MEDSAHLGTFSSELIVFSDSLYRLQHLDVSASLFHKLQRGSWNLVEHTGTLSEPFLSQKQAEDAGPVILRLL